MGRIFVTSDVHGCFDEFLEGLEKIDFKEEDVLYVIGDTNDKGPKTFETIDYIRAHENIIHIKGNHEYVLQIAIEGDERVKEWTRHDGKKVVEDMERRGEHYKEDIYKYIKDLPHYMFINDTFLLMHGGFNVDITSSKREIKEIVKEKSMREELLLNRQLWLDTFDKELKKEDFGSSVYNIIIGHTPMQNAFEKETKVGIRINRFGKKVICTDTGVFTPADECDGKLAFIEIDGEEVIGEWYVASRM
ncbi:MAG: metallophosphoesterase [Clostridium sp.]|uniref:metallophosphoesterase n=1 Tax=Clostridium sp. TaxID=1506 RepID=UPI003F2C57B9